MEINENEVYTPFEAQKLLKISPSTMTRLIKRGAIQAAKLGKQYRIMGKELLRAVSPKLEDRVGKLYNKGRQWIHEGVDGPPRVRPKKIVTDGAKHPPVTQKSKEIRPRGIKQEEYSGLDQ